jgi:hypothetical protein
MLSRSLGLLVDASAEAVQALRMILRKRTATDSARIRAAVAILELAPKLREATELAGQVAALEDRLVPSPVRRVR